MSLRTIGLSSNIKALYRYKLFAYSRSLTSLVIVQIVALILSLNGTNHHGSFFGNVSISIYSYTANMVLAFTMLWMFSTAISLTTKAFREADLTLVANRFTSHLSNFLFLMTTSILAGVSAILSGFLLKLIAVYIFKMSVISSAQLPFSHLLLGLAAASLYMMLVSSAGFLTGMLAQWHKSFMFIIPAAVIALLFIEWNWVEEDEFSSSAGSMPALIALFRWFGTENSFPIFTLKVLFAVLICYGLSYLLASRLEVK